MKASWIESTSLTSNCNMTPDNQSPGHYITVQSSFYCTWEQLDLFPNISETQNKGVFLAMPTSKRYSRTQLIRSIKIITMARRILSTAKICRDDGTAWRKYTNEKPKDEKQSHRRETTGHNSCHCYQYVLFYAKMLNIIASHAIPHV